MRAPVADIQALRGDLAAAAQAVYDAWAQDEDGFDEELGAGGACQDIAAAIANVLSGRGVDVWTACSGVEQHVYCLALCADGVVEIDVPHQLYERGAGYVWRKIDGVRFSADDVVVEVIDPAVENAPLYRDDDPSDDFACPAP